MSEFDEVKQALDEAKKLLILKNSPGGKVIIKKLEDEIERQTDKVSAMYSDLSHIQIITELSKLAVRRNLLKSILYSEEQVQILKDELKDEQDKK